MRQISANNPFFLPKSNMFKTTNSPSKEDLSEEHATFMSKLKWREGEATQILKN